MATKETQYLIVHDVPLNEVPEGGRIRLDAFLKERIKGRSRAQIQRAIDSGVISIHRNLQAHHSVGKIKASVQLLAGDQVHVLTTRKPEPKVDFNYKILFEDTDLFVIDKPGNLPVHPAGRFFFNTLWIHLKTEGFTRPLQSEREFYLVHRIDRETSGLLVLTKTRDTSAKIVEQFAKRKTEKRYLAIVHGTPKEDRFEVNLAMNRIEGSRIRVQMHPVDESEGGLPAETKFHVLHRKEKFALVECFPKTGRQHQLRVHLKAVGHPIVGDKLYGLTESESLRLYEPEFTKGSSERFISPETKAKLILPRHALHAAGIRFEHPVTRLKLELNSELPQDLKDFYASQKGPELSTVEKSDWVHI
jgi:23S rRNA pseudouridine1911/1915/1917 synthase